MNQRSCVVSACETSSREGENLLIDDCKSEVQVRGNVVTDSTQMLHGADQTSGALHQAGHYIRILQYCISLSERADNQTFPGDRWCLPLLSDVTLTSIRVRSLWAELF